MWAEESLKLIVFSKTRKFGIFRHLFRWWYGSKTNRYWWYLRAFIYMFLSVNMWFLEGQFIFYCWEQKLYIEIITSLSCNVWIFGFLFIFSFVFSVRGLKMTLKSYFLFDNKQEQVSINIHWKFLLATVIHTSYSGFWMDAVDNS